MLGHEVIILQALGICFFLSFFDKPKNVWWSAAKERNTVGNAKKKEKGNGVTHKHILLNVFFLILHTWSLAISFHPNN